MRARDRVRRQLRAVAARAPELFAAGTRVLVGYSGGQDSTCLLHSLVEHRPRLAVMAAHVDHALRADSAADARRVAESAAMLGVPIEVRRVDVAAYRRGLPGWSIQQTARAARYQTLAAVAADFGAAALLVAHTADDQAETLLLNLVRGTGLAGLAGMRLDEAFDVGQLGPPLDVAGTTRGAASKIRLVRPLLGVTRATTGAYCAEVGLAVVEDASNQSRAYARNRVRLDLLPMLEGFNPAIREVLARTADLAAEDVAALDEIVAARHAALANVADPAMVRYELGAWRAQPRALQRRLLRYGLAALVGTLDDVRAAPIEDALELLARGAPGQTYHLPNGVELAIEAVQFVLRVHGGARSRSRPNTWGTQLPRV